MRLATASVVLVCLAAACSRGASHEEVYHVGDSEAVHPLPAPMAAPERGAVTQVATAAQGVREDDRARILEGRIRVRVASVDSAMVQAGEVAARLGGYAGSRAVHHGEERRRSGTIELRVPAARFDEAMAALTEIGRMEHSSVNATEVGDQLVDLRARLDNARRLEARLQEVLRTRTGNLQEVLAVERELARIREEIERTDAQLARLTDRVRMSTIHVEAFTPGPVLAATPVTPVLSASVRQAWRNLIGFIAFAIESLGILLPLGAIVLVSLPLLRRIRAARARRRAPEPTGGEATAGGILGS